MADAHQSPVCGKTRSNPKEKLGQNQHCQPACNIPNKPTDNKTCHSQNQALALGEVPGTTHHTGSFIHLPHGILPTPQGSGCHTGMEAKAQRGPNQMLTQRDLRLPCKQSSPYTCPPTLQPHRRAQIVGKQPVPLPFHHPNIGPQLDHTG